jgi:acyl-CoA synthetase (AMP-forming)/AMP-acid ligase II
MNPVAQLLAQMAAVADRDALVWQDRAFTFGSLNQLRNAFQAQLAGAGVPTGAVVALEADFSPAGVAALLALLELGAVAVPLTPRVQTQQPGFRATAEVEWRLAIDAQDQGSLVTTERRATHELIRTLRERGHPGLILFSSGSTGRSKAVVHDGTQLLRKYLRPRHCFRTLAFLLFDHIGGLDGLFYNLANGSCLVTLPDHAPETVCAVIARHRVAVLPVTPTFLNLLLLSGAHARHDLGSLQIITYGAEVMTDQTLARLRQAFPHVKLMQKFGTSEVGALRSQSRDSGSGWIKLGGEGYQTRVRDGSLEIKADSAMLGYLNAPSPFTPDGWFQTGDAVEVDGEWLRILGRRSEMINVGGEKVYPAEVENVLQTLGGVEEVTVGGAPNVITGQMVVARVKLRVPETPALFRQRLRDHCRGQLPEYKIPQKVILVEESLGGGRFKKMRHAGTWENAESRT